MNTGEAVLDVTPEQLLGMFAAMTRIRRFEDRVADLVNSGEARCPCHLCVGQEAIAVGVCGALRRDDYVWGGHRSHGHYLAKGGDLAAMMAEILGKKTGCCEGRGGSMHLFAPEVGILGTVPLVAATIPLAVGSALASKLRGDGRVSVAFFGDGAVEEGHAHESMNLAAVYKLPIVFVCENNFYASHMALLERRAEDNVARAGALHGMPAACLDGNDVVTVWRESVKAVDRARRGEGPTLLECRTYRWRGHVGPSYDMDVGVRRKDELGEWRTRDPLPRAREALVSRGMAASRLADLERRVDVEIDDAVAAAQCAPYPAVTELLDHVYAPGGATL